MRDPGPLEQVGGADQAVVPLVEAVVGRGRAGVEARTTRSRRDLGRCREDRVVLRRLAGRRERHLLVAQGQVGAGDQRLERREHRVEVVPLAAAGARVVLGRAVPDRVVPEQVAAHHQGGGTPVPRPPAAARPRAGVGRRGGGRVEPDRAGRRRGVGARPRGAACRAPRPGRPAATTAPTAARARTPTVEVTHTRGSRVAENRLTGWVAWTVVQRAQPGRPRPGARRAGRPRRRPSELDVLVVGGRSGRRRGRARRGDPGAQHRAAGAARPGQRHQQPQQQADPRRAPLPRDARLRAGPRGAAGARAAAHPAGAAPGPAGAVPLPADPPRLGAALRRRRAAAVRRDGDARQGRDGAAAAPAPVPQGRWPGSRRTSRRSRSPARSATTTARSTTPGWWSPSPAPPPPTAPTSRPGSR